jgi:hypothetical protein
MVNIMVRTSLFHRNRNPDQIHVNDEGDIIMQGWKMLAVVPVRH